MKAKIMTKKGAKKMKTVNEILTPDKSLFGAFATTNQEMYRELFGDTATSDLDMQLLVKCGSRYCSPLLSHYELAKVINFLVTKYGDNWKRIKETLQLDYDVLAPYNVSQKTISEKTVENTNTGESKQENGIVGFDSDTATPSAVDTNTDTNTQNANESGLVNTTNSGNNGNFKNGDLILNELEVRKTSFIEIVLNDIQSQITLDIY